MPPSDGTILTLPQMVDLALNTPEVGVVNFTILHSLMHVILSHLRMNEVSIQFKGQDSDRMETYIKCAKPGSSFLLTHYVVTGEQDHVKKTNENKDHKETKNSKEQEIELSEKERVPSIILQNTLAVSKEQLEAFESELNALKQKVQELSELPADMKIIEALTNQDEKSPVLDMYQILNLTKRVDAMEVSIGKFATLLEKVTKASVSGVQSAEAVAAINEIMQQSPLTKSIDCEGLEQRVKKIESTLNILAGEGEEDEQDKPLKSGTKLKFGGIKPATPSLSQLSDTVNSLREELLNIKNTVDGFMHSIKDIENFKDKLGDPKAQPVDVRITNVESRLPTIEEQIALLDSGFTRTVNTLSNRFTDVETELGELLEKINLFSDPHGDKTTAINATEELHNQLIILEEELKNIVEKQNILLEERENKQHSLDVITEQVELLKAVKADREDLEDALADKADACLINRKVSYEQFDQAYGDMSKGIEEALARLTQQESLWSHALEDLQKDVGSKMDRMELNPLRDFINTKLKNLQEKFKTLTSLKREQEAAGTKSKYLRNVNCISCDKDVVMRKEMDPSMYPKPTTLPPTRSMGPYLAYELDQLRKQQRCLPSNKNLNIFENALLAGKAAKSPDHICNRYCGGSHTVTSPQQRVARVGHFLEQWGPEIAPVNDTQIRGTDGQIYKARDDAHLKQLASEKPPSIHPAQKPSLHISGDVTRRSKENGEGNEKSAPTSARNRK